MKSPNKPSVYTGSECETYEDTSSPSNVEGKVAQDKVRSSVCPAPEYGILRVLVRPCKL